MIRYIISLIPLILFTNITYVHHENPINDKIKDSVILNEDYLNSEHMFNILSELKENKEKLNKLKNK